MYIEERDYIVKPGCVPTFVSRYEQYGLPLQLKYLGTFHGYFTTEIGELNHVVAWWSYKSLDQRQEGRGKMLADPLWGQYLDMVTHLLERQSSRILKPVSFSPLK
ncbi:MAG: NIPSNAP family protein [Hyphomicrobiales bacterium]